MDIAGELGKPYSTLMRECNPFDKGAKLGVNTFFRIMIITKDIEPLRFMANSLGYALVKM